MRKATIKDLELELWLRQRERGHIVWTTARGEDIPITEMSDTHLVNTINMLNRMESIRDSYYEALGSLGDTEL